MGCNAHIQYAFIVSLFGPASRCTALGIRADMTCPEHEFCTGFFREIIFWIAHQQLLK